MSSDLMDWAAAHLEDARVKAIVGVRGANKTGALEAVRNLLRARGVDAARLVSIDFEDVRFRRLKTADDVLAFLHRLPGCAMPRYLFLDEISRVGAHAELLRRLHELPAWNASSTATAVGAGDEAFRPYPWICAFRQWTDPHLSRSPCELERIWCQIFMRDVACCVNHPDIRAKEALAEFLSDHLGEPDDPARGRGGTARVRTGDCGEFHPRLPQGAGTVLSRRGVGSLRRVREARHPEVRRAPVLHGSRVAGVAVWRGADIRGGARRAQ